MARIPLTKLQLALNLHLYSHQPKQVIKRFVTQADILILSVELGGHFSFVKGKEMILLGHKEVFFLATKSKEEQRDFYRHILRPTTAFVVVCDQQEVASTLQEIAKEWDVVIFQSSQDLKEVYIRLSAYITSTFSPNTLFHGTLLEIYGQGVILMGKSGIGKSEVALELIKKGHRLVADDAIIINQIGHEIHGHAPAHLKYFLEVRGIGLIDVYKMFGINSIADHKTIRYVVLLDHLDGNQGIKRLEEAPAFHRILNVEVPSATILVGGGRNIADLVEVAVTNLRLRAKGYNPTQELIDKHQKLLEGGNDDD